MQARSAPIVLAALLFVSCADPATSNRGAPIAVPQGLGMAWGWLSHRISVLEVTLEPGAAGFESGTVVAENHGGSFGALDMPSARYDHRHVESGALAHELASVMVEIPPGSTVDGVDFSALVDASIPLGSLRGASAVAGFVRGFRIDTDRYATPPAFVSDPTLPYAPATGYTSLGFGMGVSEPTVDGDTLRFTVRARNGLGTCDRGDMNAAIPQATTWVRVDLIFVGAFGATAKATTSSIAYTVDDPTYGDGLPTPHAPLATRMLDIAGAPGRAHGFAGLRSFDIFVNTAGHYAATCTVMQDPINFWMEPISGPGRYLSAASATLGAFAYDPTTGSASVDVDLYVSNASGSYEEGNVCAGMQGEVTLVQFDDPSATIANAVSTAFQHYNDDVWLEPVALP